MTVIVRDGRIRIAAAFAVELVAMLLAAFLYRGLVGGGALVDALGWVGVGVVVGLAWFAVSALVVWSVVGVFATRESEASGKARSRLETTGRTLLAGYVADGVGVALIQAKYVATHPIEWTDMAFLNFATRFVVEVATWPWTVFAFFGA